MNTMSKDDTPCTDAGNAERFVDQHGNTVKYLESEKRWIVYDGTRWTSKKTKVYSKAISTARKIIYVDAKACKPGDAREGELVSWGKRSQSRSRIEAMLKLASETLTVEIGEFDTDADLINCINGVVNLRTGELLKHSPDQRFMKRANVRYNPDAKTELWDTFLSGVFQNDEKLIDTVSRFLGYSLTGETKEQQGIVAYGLGENGKTTLFETVLKMLGDYATTTTFSTFLKRKTEGARDLEALSVMKGKRFALASETSNTAQLDEATYKRATGGDTLTGANLYSGRYDFTPTHKLFLQCNHLPTVKDATHAFWRRPLVIPFKATFDKPDKNLRYNLWNEREGIFARLVKEAVDYYKTGLGEIAPAILEATKEWREDNDVLSRFISDCLEREFDAKLSLEKDGHTAYRKWCFDANETPASVGNFAKGLKERGIVVKREKAGNIIVNYKIKTTKPEETKPRFQTPYERSNMDTWRGMSEDEKRQYEGRH